MLNFGHGIFQKVMEKVMESHGILIGQMCTNPDLDQARGPALKPAKVDVVSSANIAF